MTKSTPLLFVLAAATLFLSACGTDSLLTSKEPQQTIYALRPGTPAAAAPYDLPAQIVEIAHPILPPGMDRDRIALYLDGGRKLDYFAAARWSSTLDDVVQEFTRRTASSVLPYVIAVTPEENIDPHYRLQVKILDFQPVYDADAAGTPMIEAIAEFTLIALPSDTVLTSFVLGKRGKANANRLDVVTAGLEKMLQEIEHEAFVRIDRHLRPDQAVSSSR